MDCVGDAVTQNFTRCKNLPGRLRAACTPLCSLPGSVRWRLMPVSANVPCIHTAHLRCGSDIYDPKTLAVMDHAFAAIWNQEGRMTPSATCPRLRVETCHRAKSTEPVADGETDPIRLRWLTVENLLFPRP